MSSMSDDEALCRTTATGMRRRLVQWAINWYNDYFEVIRYEDGRIILIGHYTSRQEARIAAEGNRAMVLADPRAVETAPLEQRTRLS